ncbi:PRC-barrel domain-containing protein [Sphingopyxis sp. KK2]|uniref:PRC-barrel domain-containing protein n=1 Tax=Sphingopyxis sp. KK2 TaxID=1855727 RepID=UPI00097E72E4|nr:PRC-barrel domain-containing protein [Sphingopyxis sp. KK2]
MTDPELPTQLLIQSNKADTMPVKTRDGDKLGSVHAYMINKRSGHTAYAILSIGGFLGMGKAYYPLPFQLLAFEPTSDSYVVTIDRRVLEGGPSWAANPPIFDQAYADRVASYYEVSREDLSLGGGVPIDAGR